MVRGVGMDVCSRRLEVHTCSDTEPHLPQSAADHCGREVPHVALSLLQVIVAGYERILHATKITSARSIYADS